MRLGRRARLFGIRPTIRQGGESIIYGLQFDGISDFVEDVNLTTATSDGYLEIKCTLRNDTPLEALVAQGGGANIVYNDAANNRLWCRINSANVFFTGVGSYQDNAQHTIRFDVDGSNNWTLSIDGNVIDTKAATGGLYDIDFIAARNDSGATPYTGIFEHVDLNGMMASDANSWNGATINGATRVKSTDGGATWTPA